ncbi:glycosyltransferase family 2 protein [Alcaligenes endophyticus]|uniref:Glycosyltransferase family 2 protein n=1 Tax=Alcaligenes endophyticus TaxID=1929088 RepID=A0ABT8END9_9BURK|nr:glycosyltransferase family 2 protein [Alcaligenes endophyticus]MCX5591300.1 glycosyltransferase family 2 protein [Alcaligenes endophyticus]MDN4122819.1 glycosyltransferase family 2 protein [Alcaligenes endophyticus]
MTLPTLSVIIITKNEQAHIQACLESVAFADEIIVVDSGSTDRTVEIAAAFGAKVSITTDWPGFGPQKNRALDLATSEWVLSIDADERVTPELADSIRQELTQPRATAYRIARLSEFAGRWIRHSGWWPDRVLRLFRRDLGRFTTVKVHERVNVSGSVLTLQGHFLHYPYASLEVFINKINQYSSSAAQQAFERGKRTSVIGPFGHSFWTFLRHYVLRRGFLDGWQGLFLAGMAATGSFYRYVKLYSLIRRKK